MQVFEAIGEFVAKHVLMMYLLQTLNFSGVNAPATASKERKKERNKGYYFGFPAGGGYHIQVAVGKVPRDLYFSGTVT